MKKLLLTLFLILGAVGLASADTVEYTFADGDYSAPLSINDDLQISFAQGGNTQNATKWNKTYVAFYGGNIMTICGTTQDVNITKFVFTLSQNFKTSDVVTVSTGEYDYDNKTWTGSANSINLQNGANSSTAQAKITKIEIEYTVTSSGPKDYTFPITEDLTLEVGKTHDLGLGTNHPKINWSFSKEGIVSIDENNVLTALAEGSTTVTATWSAGTDDKWIPGSGKFDVTVTVPDPNAKPKDIITASDVKTSSYTSSNEVTGKPSGVVYKVQTMKNGDNMQMNAATTGFVTSKNETGKTVKSVTVNWATTTAGRSVKVYASNEAFTSVAAGNATEIGTVTYASDKTTATVSVPDDYSYVAVLGNAAAVYVSSFEIEWVDNSKQSPNLSFPAGPYKGYVDKDFDEPKLTTDPEGLTVTYSSSNEEVATVDASTGEVTLIAAGKVTITAKSAETETYRSGSASYEITVSAAPYTSFNQLFDLPAETPIEMATTMTVVYQHGLNLYAVTDDGAAMLIYGDLKTTLNNGDSFTMLSGKMAYFNGQIEIANPVIESEINTGGDAVLPTVKNINDITKELSCQYVKIEGVTVAALDDKKNSSASVDGTPVALYNTFGITWPTDLDAKYTLVGFVGINNGTVLIRPTELIEVPDDRADAKLSFGENTEFTCKIGEDFTAPELTNPHELTVKYTSSKTDVAEVDEETGAVTIKAEGSTTITATFEGNDEYKYDSASYTLTVDDPNTYTYLLVTDAAQLGETSTIIIASRQNGVVMGSQSDNGKYCNKVELEGLNEKTTSISYKKVYRKITITKREEDGYYNLSEDIDGATNYFELGYTTSGNTKNNNLTVSSTKSDASDLKVSIDPNGTATITNSTYTLQYHPTSGQERFASYTTSHEDVQIFMLVNQQELTQEEVEVISLDGGDVDEAYDIAMNNMFVNFRAANEKLKYKLINLPDDLTTENIKWTEVVKDEDGKSEIKVVGDGADVLVTVNVCGVHYFKAVFPGDMKYAAFEKEFELAVYPDIYTHFGSILGRWGNIHADWVTTVVEGDEKEMTFRLPDLTGAIAVDNYTYLYRHVEKNAENAPRKAATTGPETVGFETYNATDGIKLNTEPGIHSLELAVSRNGVTSPIVTANYELDEDGSVTGISFIEADGTEAELYDLNGRKVVGTPAAGLYIEIRNGKAVKVVK